MLNGYAEIIDKAIVIEGQVTSYITPYSYTRLNRDGTPKMQEIAALISANPQCNEVKIFNFEFLDTALYDFVQNLKNIQKVKLHVKDLEICRRFEWGAKDPFVEFVTDNNVLEELDLSNQPLGDKTVFGIINAIKKNPNSKLKVLNLQSVSLDEGAACALAEFLETNKTLEALNINHNNIGAIAAIKIAQALEKNTTLKELYIAGCGIFKNLKPRTLKQVENESKTERDAAGKVFAAMLHKNKTLQVLNLSSNWIKTKASIEIAKALRVNNTLHAIYMFDNYMPDLAANEWATTIKENNSLLRIDIHGMNHLTFEGATALASAFKDNKTLEEIKFWYNNFDAKHYGKRNKKLKPQIAANRKANPPKAEINDSEPDITGFFKEYLQNTQAPEPIKKPQAPEPKKTDDKNERPKTSNTPKIDDTLEKPQAPEPIKDTANKNSMLIAIGITVVALVGAVYLCRNTNIICKVLPKVLGDMLSKGCELSR